MNRKEQSLQTAICSYMKLQYPKVIFKVDAGADANKTSHIAMEVYKKQQYKRGYPDFQIIKPSAHYNGLFLELKGCYDDLFNKNETMQRGDKDHHVEQYDFIKELREAGYAAFFCWSMDDAIRIISNYLEGHLIPIEIYKFNSLTIAERKEIEANKFFEGRGL